MKTKLFILMLAIAGIVMAFVFENSSKIRNESTTRTSIYTLPNNNITDNFIIGSLHTGVDINFNIQDSLGLNLWHIYISQGKFGTRDAPAGWTYWAPYDSLDRDISEYSSDVQGVLSDISTHNMKAFLQRPKIEWLCYGQRSDYECEDAGYVDDDLFFYTFQIHETGVPVTDSGAKVVFCRIENSTTQGSSWHNAGFVVKRLKCNTEQSKPSGTGNQWQSDGDCRWFIKPKIRIDSSIAHNNGNTNICKIIILRRPGDTLRAVTIKASNFIEPVSGNYGGQYIEEFYSLQPSDSLAIQNNWNDTWEWRSRGDWYRTECVDLDSCNDSTYRSKVDIQVYWYGLCDMWIDYVRVDNDVAHNLFGTGQTHDLYEQWIEDEALEIADHSNGYNSPLKFYIELAEFNNIPCIAYVNERLQSLGAGVDMVTDVTFHYAIHVNWDNKNAVMNAGHIKRNYIDKINAKQIFMESYPLTSAYYRDPGPTNTYSRIPYTLSTNSGDDILAHEISPADYDEWLQENLDKSPYIYEPTGAGSIPAKIDVPAPCSFTDNNPWQDAGNFRFIMQTGREISREANIPFIYMQQAQHWFTPLEVRREPTNEEMSLLTNLAVSYGAKGIVYYWFANHLNDPDCDYSYGLTDAGNQKRLTNVYGQPKWDTMRSIISRLKKWDPYLMSFDNEKINSYIYYNPTERTSLFSNSYFSDVVTYYPYDNPQPCQEDSPGIDSPTGLQYDCKNARYVQVATFEKESGDGYKYFMIVNRRCSPFKNDSHLDSNGGRRLVKVKFGNHSGHLGTPNNWTIFDVTNTRTPVAQFTVTSNQWADLGWFMPGEGRIYKMAPTPKTGGTLLADEHISGQSFTCEDTVISNGFDITIDEGSVISFTDSATIIMNGGTFTSGVHGTGSPDLVTYKGVGSGKWNGLRFNGTDVNIYNSKFQDIASPCVNYAISMVDCQFADIRTNQFVLNTDTAGAIQSVYIEDPFGSPSYTGLHINYNSITMANSRGYGISVQGFSGITLPLYAGNNTMTSNGYATGLLLSTITGGVVKNNSITGFSTGINTLLSTIDVYGNTISNTSSVSKGIIATGLSSSGLLPASGLWLGGMNSITNTSGVSTNIEVNNSVFSLEGGNNTFDVTSTSGAYHLYGTFWDSSYNNYQRYNCFKLGGSTITSPTNPNYSISNGFASITLNFIDYTCNATPPEDVTVVDLGNGLYDTIPYSGGGESGSKSSINHLPLTKGETQRGSYAYILSNSALYDSIRIQIRKKNYNAAKESCYELIDTYPDSSESISALSYLFLSQTTADTTQTAIGNLKSYYEGLILNHGNNTAMVTMCNYLVQKCKVKLHQYTSALSGFQEIINNNPYSYEGLLAKWDYMATSLLVQGQGGGESSIAELEDEEYSDDDDTPKSKIRNPKSSNERSPFTKEERQTIRQSVVFANERVKNDREAKIKTLEERSKSGDVGSEKELRTLRMLKDVNKSVKPANVFEHINIVSGDIQKVFATDVVIGSRQENLVPSAFSLSQNYPNPFNPVTTIKYALPHDVKVVVRIYDILGREVKVLVNELQKAGYYDAKFDGSNFASGVYFYRIEAGDFVLAKKMVLIK